MPNHKSAKKALKQSLERRDRNRQWKSVVKTFFKKVEVKITENDHEGARKALSVAQSKIMKAVTKGVYHWRTASRKVSRTSDRIKKAFLIENN